MFPHASNINDDQSLPVLWALQVRKVGGPFITVCADIIQPYRWTVT